MKNGLFRLIVIVGLFAWIDSIVPNVEGAEEVRLTFVTSRGVQFENAKVLRVEPDGISLLCASGIIKVPFEDLPVEVRERFGMQAERASQYRAHVTGALRARDDRARALDKQRAAEQQVLDSQRAAARAQQEKADEEVKKKNAAYNWHFGGRNVFGRVVLVQDDLVVIRKSASVGQDGTWAVNLYNLPASERERALWIGERLTPEERLKGERILNNYEKWLNR